MRKWLLYAGLAILLFFDVTSANATEQYQSEVSVFYSSTDGSTITKTALISGHPATRATTGIIGLSGQVFFTTVNEEEHSYADAVFLERVGSVFVSAANEHTRVQSVESDSPLESVGVNLASPGFPLAAQFLYTKSLVNFNTPDDLYIKSDVYDARIGNYFAKTFFAGFEYDYGTAEPTSNIFPYTIVRSWDYGIFAKYVHEFAGYRELSFEAKAGKSTIGNNDFTLRNTSALFIVDYFFNKNLDVGVGFEHSSGTAVLTEGKTYSASVRYFIIPRLSIQASYHTFKNSNPDFENQDTYSLTLAGRF